MGTAVIVEAARTPVGKQAAHVIAGLIAAGAIGVGPSASPAGAGSPARIPTRSASVPRP